MKHFFSLLSVIIQAIIFYVLVATSWVQDGGYLQTLAMLFLAALAITAAWMGGFLDGADAADEENDRLYVHQIEMPSIDRDRRADYRELAFPPINHNFLDSKAQVENLASQADGLAVIG